MFRAICWLGWCASALAAPLTADEPPAPFAEAVQGDWSVLTAHSNNDNLATGERLGSRVRIAADRLEWLDPAAPEAPLVSAVCVRAPAPAASAPAADPNELASTVRGSLCPVQAASLRARWRLTDDGVLLALVEIAAYEGARNGSYSGASAADVLLICQREPVPAALPPDAAGDARRFPGVWTRLAELDDANSARTRPEGNVVFTESEFYKRGSYAADARPQMEGSWTLQPAAAEHGRIDLHFRSGIEGNQGRSPGLYAFFGDDLLMIVFPEGGWKKEAADRPELREPPTHLRSDGNRNFWILRRRG